MADPNETTHLSGEEARGGSSSQMTRYILPVSLILIIVIFAVMVFR